MGSTLMDIQPSILRYANIISKVLKVEVEIVDSDLIRVAGTGVFKAYMNRSLKNEGFVYKNVLLTGKPSIIHEPGMETICAQCPKSHNCNEKFEASTPIKFGGEIIGVIGLVCFEQYRKEELLKDFDTYMEFLQQISDFIGVTVYERKEKMREQTILKSMNLVIDKMDRGVIILNRSNRITHINSKGAHILKFSDEFFKYQVLLEETGENILDMKGYLLHIGSKTIHIAGSIYPMELNEEQFHSMLIFQDIRNFRQIVSDMSMSGRDICCENILGESPQMMELKKNIKRIAYSPSTVLITGESGTGKEMFARAVHNEGNRRNGPFVAINCGAIPYELLESELFGYVRGAFTGASNCGKMGKFELANNGTIFLDEIGDMPFTLQTKLLRVLQERNIVRVGSNKPIDIDVRVIAATNRDILQLIQEKKFREDLYYRLNVIPFNIPPLRERVQDIDILVKYFITKYTGLLNKKIERVEIEPEVWNVFYRYSWPGNVRELENTIEYMINMANSGGRFTLNMIPGNIMNNGGKAKETDSELHKLKELEKREIEKALEIFGRNTQGKRIASQKLGIGIATLYRKIEEYGLSK